MDLSRLTQKAKGIVSKRGGTDALREDAEELKDIASGGGSTKGKAKEAFDAIKDPGAPGPEDRGPAGSQDRGPAGSQDRGPAGSERTNRR